MCLWLITYEESLRDTATLIKLEFDGDTKGDFRSWHALEAGTEEKWSIWLNEKMRGYKKWGVGERREKEVGKWHCL